LIQKTSLLKKLTDLEEWKYIEKIPNSRVKQKNIRLHGHYNYYKIKEIADLELDFEVLFNEVLIKDDTEKIVEIPVDNSTLKSKNESGIKGSSPNSDAKNQNLPVLESDSDSYRKTKVLKKFDRRIKEVTAFLKPTKDQLEAIHAANTFRSVCDAIYYFQVARLMGSYSGIDNPNGYLIKMLVNHFKLDPKKSSMLSSYRAIHVTDRLVSDLELFQVYSLEIIQDLKTFHRESFQHLFTEFYSQESKESEPDGNLNGDEATKFAAFILDLTDHQIPFREWRARKLSSPG
jgi:hypothetical protein